MSVEEHSVVGSELRRAKWRMIAESEEIGELARLPLRIPSGLQAVPCEEGVALVGASSAQMLSGVGLRAALGKILPLLDGSRTSADLVRDCEGLTEDYVHSMLAHLLESGLLRSGPEPDPTSEVELYLDRFVGVTGVFSSGVDAARRLSEARLAISAPEEMGSWMVDLWSRSGGRAARCVRAPGELDKSISLLMVVTTQASSNPAALFARAAELRIPALNVEIVAAGARIGPLVLPNLSASYPCYREAHAPLGSEFGSPDSRVMKMWAACATHMALGILSRTLLHPPINCFTDRLWNGERHVERRATLARLHEWDEAGRALPLGVRPGGPGYLGWRQYCGVALQSPEWSPTNSYLVHLRDENIAAIFEPSPAVHTEGAVRLPQLEEGPRDPKHDGLVLRQISTLLRYSAGLGERNGAPHRLAPTGGNLGSTLVALLVREVPELSPGAYWFSSSNSVLEPMRGAGLQETLQVLLGDADAPATLLTFGNLAKVSRKYGAFATNVCWYDAGVLLAYASEIASALGFRLLDLGAARLAEVLRAQGLLPAPLVPTGLLEVSPLGGVAPPAATPSLHDVLQAVRQRTAVRSWSAKDVPLRTLHQVAERAQLAIDRYGRLGAGTPLASLLILAKLSDAPSGFYLYTQGQCRLIREHPEDEHEGVLSQAALSRAPLIVLPRVDLARALDLEGDHGVPLAYRICGAIAGWLWLTCGSLGLAGTACGGVFEGQIRSLTSRHGLHDFHPLALCLGPRHTAHSRPAP